MNSAARGGITLLICLLAVFPCGAALTVLGTLAAEVIRSWAGTAHSAHRLSALMIPAAWAAAGVLGFLSLIYGVDRMMLAQRRLPWYVLVGILLGMAAAGFFSLTYPLHSPSARLLRVVCVAPVAIECLLFLQHLIVHSFCRPRPIEPSMPLATTPTPSSEQKTTEV